MEGPRDLPTNTKRAPADQKADDVLSQLELRELSRSEEPINQEGGKQKKLESLRPWKNYTLVSLAGSMEFQIYDENGRLIKDISKPLISRRVFVKWSDFLSGQGKRNLAKVTISPWDTMNISELSPFGRELALRAMEQNKVDTIYIGNGFITDYTVSHISVTSDEKYVVMQDRNGNYIAFITQNEAGISLSPRNWTRIDASYAGQIPEGVRKYVDTLKNELVGFKELNDQYSVLVTDVSINIVKKDNPKGAPVFSDSKPSVDKNITKDPANPNIIYYCSANSPRDIQRLDLSGDPNTWSPISAELPKQYGSIKNLQLDPSGNFFLFYSEKDLVIMSKETLEEVKRVPELREVNFDSQGRIRAVDKDGYLVIYEPQFEGLVTEIEKRRIAKLAQGIRIEDIFDLELARNIETEQGGEELEHLTLLRGQYEQQFAEVLAKVDTREEVEQLRRGFVKLKETLLRQGLKPNEILYVVQGIEKSVIEKEKEFAIKDAREALVSIRSTLNAGLSISTLSEARDAMNRIRASESLLDDDLRREVRETTQELELRGIELFSQRGGEIIKDVQGLVTRSRTDLEAFTTKGQMDDWLEFRFPQLKSRLGALAKDTPIEADEAYKAITAARLELEELASTFEAKFKEQYAKIREKAVERMEGTVDALVQDVHGLIERIRAKGFTDRRAAENYLLSSEARRTLEAEITALSSQNPDVAKELDRALKVQVSNLMTEIERGTLTQVAETGQQMILFGKTMFPKWEAAVKEKAERTVELVFDEDPKTHGPGIKAGDILGDASLMVRMSDGSFQKVRLYEGWQDENEWRFGLPSYRGEALPASYVSAKDFRGIKKAYSDWSQGEKSVIRKELEQKRNALREIYARREKIGERTPEIDVTIKEEYSTALKEYADFCAKNFIGLLQRIDQVKNEPDLEHSNGKGFVPEWQSHWVMDPQSERDLEEMAKSFKMQMDLQEGLLNLKGHAGTGKDVRIKMFCALTKRPYFGIDCTKWTTEFELSEDVMLESKEGASQTIKVPSAVLNGITTPGAVVYFNEYNAMPEQAQIFLHALMDEKRSLTLKTSSGRVIKAHPSVLLAASMNPGYPGTFEPQFATRSRMVSQEIGYPPLLRQPDTNDANPNAPYDASEALRLARGIDSLADLTYEASLERNEFVKMWDRYVNGIQNGAPEPTGTEKFDIDTTLALVQFANILRENFIKIFEKSRDARNALPVTQPITGRELRRCAYALSLMTPEEKATANPEVVARNLLEQFYLTHIDKKEDQGRIRTAMASWTSKKRLRA